MIAEPTESLSDYLLTLIAPHGSQGIKRSILKTKLMSIPARVLDHHIADLVSRGVISEATAMAERCDGIPSRPMIIYRPVCNLPVDNSATCVRVQTDETETP